MGMGRSREMGKWPVVQKQGENGKPNLYVSGRIYEGLQPACQGKIRDKKRKNPAAGRRPSSWRQKSSLVREALGVRRKFKLSRKKVLKVKISVEVPLYRAMEKIKRALFLMMMMFVATAFSDDTNETDGNLLAPTPSVPLGGPLFEGEHSPTDSEGPFSDANAYESEDDLMAPRSSAPHEGGAGGMLAPPDEPDESGDSETSDTESDDEWKSLLSGVEDLSTDSETPFSDDSAYESEDDLMAPRSSAPLEGGAGGMLAPPDEPDKAGDSKTSDIESDDEWKSLLSGGEDLPTDSEGPFSDHSAYESEDDLMAPRSSVPLGGVAGGMLAPPDEPDEAGDSETSDTESDDEWKSTLSGGEDLPTDDEVDWSSDWETNDSEMSDSAEELLLDQEMGESDHEDQEKTTKSYCLSLDSKPHMGFAAMTPYSAAVGNNLSINSVAPEGCHPVQLWHLIRHGSRSMHRIDLMKMETQLPFLKRKILAAHSLGNGELCAQDLSLIRSWKIDMMEMGPSGRLTHEGKVEIEGIASRLKALFPDLVYKPYHVDKAPSENIRKKPGEGTRIAFAPSRQTYESAVSYLEMLYGNRWGHVGLSVTGSPVLQFFDQCRNYVNEVVLLDKNQKPFHTFTKGKIFEAIMNRISKRIGVSLTLTKLRTMYNACRYLKAWYPLSPSPWCAVFTPRDLQVLEYWEDLRIYHDHGHAHKISYNQACVLGKDILLHFRNRIEHNKTDIDATTYFANMEATVPLITLLGLFKDEDPLTEETINWDRLWQTSRFAGYGSNLAFVLSSCGEKSWWVSALLNEASIKLPGCETSLGCPWKRFVEKFNYIESYDFNELCGRRSHKLWRSQNWRLHYIINNWM
ncbi:uncharacterized protein LOC122246093 [Penaeus japonicus]|uniref:uncharacterized protein LOC122246093 n=1 Tax=Penaeus japonicus TaxID=27405 RepID=UPI001C712B98|nr:uncharacterized protein LOC122246093 [Penaeus japonicus]